MTCVCNLFRVSILSDKVFAAEGLDAAKAAGKSENDFGEEIIEVHL